MPPQNSNENRPLCNVEDALVCLVVVPFSYKATNTTSPMEGEQVEPALKWWVGLVHKIDKSLSLPAL